MANFPSVTAGGAFESTAVQNAIKTLAEQAVEDRLAALEYDSGPRNVSALASEYTSSTAGQTLLRIGRAVEYRWFVQRMDKKAPVNGDVLFTLPPGFRPVNTYRIAALQPTGLQMQVASGSGAVTILDKGPAAQGSYCTFTLTHLTNDAAPATPPGSPA